MLPPLQRGADRWVAAGSGTVEIGDGAITVGPVMSTKMACELEPAQLESTIFGLLAGEVPYDLDGDRLTLGTGAAQLIYRAAD